MDIVDVAILSCSFRRVFDLLESPVLKEFQSCYGADEDLKDLRKKLRKMQAVLDDADHKQVRNDWVKEWLVDVRDLAYDAEDIVDLYATEAGRWNQVRNSSSHASSSSTNLNKLKKDFDIESRLKEIIEKSEELVKLIDELCLKPDVVGRPTTEIVPRERVTSSLIDESRVFGREDDTTRIVELLLSDGPSGGDEVGVLPIVGMGGLGKTTLAQLVYKDERVEGHFDIKAWVCVSEEFDVARITRDILESITKEGCNLGSLDSIQVSLKDKLDGKRFFIVLDDIWNENPNHWEALRKPFKSGRQGSKIIVTTRSEVVSKIMGTISAYSLQVLTDDDCWKLFMQLANVDDKYLSAHLDMKPIIEKIVEKCKGLPLAVKTLGSLLRFKDVDEWKDIVTTDIWDIPEGESSILRILRLSYQHLPLPLKPCFAYCSIFPKDHMFKKEELVWLWMAEGFVHSSGTKRMEDIGSGYFDELFSRSFFQNYEGIKRWFVMHDLVHDLALSISRETCIAVDVDRLCNVSVKARYSSLINVKRSLVDFDAFSDASRQSTFLIHFPKVLGMQLSINVEISHNVFNAWRYLRVLSLTNLPITKLPDSIGNLKVLPYLDLYDTFISTLPESIYTLYNLQTLILGFRLNELRKGIHSLINLRHIELGCIDKMPCGIGRLTNLQNLNRFMVGKEDGHAGLEELKDLIHLRGELEISCLENVVDVMDVKEANLKNKQHLYKLSLDWGGEGIVIDSGEQKRVEVEEIIECLQPHKNLKELWIYEYPVKCFPSWIAMLTGLVDMNVTSCKGIQVVPPLGQLHFLERLRFFEMLELVEWSSNVEYGQDEEGEELFSRLAYLTIKNCPKLTRLPFYRLPSLVKLYIHGCAELTALPRLKIPPHGSREGEEFPCLRQLEICSCHKLRQLPQVLPSLVDLKIKGCQQLGALSRLPLLQHLELSKCGGKALFTRLGPLPSLSRLVIFKIRGLKCLTKEFLQSLNSIKELSISNCKNLEAIGSKVVGLHNLTTLQRLKIQGCGKLFFSFPKEEEGLYLSPRLTSCSEVRLPPMLRRLEVGECKSFESLPNGLRNLTCLEELKIDKCPGLTSFTEVEDKEFVLFPPTLKNIWIEKCKNLESLPTWMQNLTSLEVMSIMNCHQLVTFLEGGWPTKLRELEISGCGNYLDSLPKCAGLHKLTSLKKLTISWCSGFRSFPKEDEEEWKLPPILRELSFKHFKRLEYFRPKWLHNLTSLDSLEISHIPKLVSLPEEGPPTTLKELRFNRLESFKFLCPKWLHNLTSLQKLHILYLPKLASLPEEGCPATLQYLVIQDCPLLKESCLDENFRPKLAHIPNVQIFDELRGGGLRCYT